MFDPKNNILIIVPAYNEENTIAKTIEGIKAATQINNQTQGTFKICVIDDGSSDNTAKILQTLDIDYIITHKHNLGLGAAVRSGLHAARRYGADIAVKFDADLQHNPLDILKIIQPIIAATAEIVYGNRFNTISYKMPFIRNIGNKVFTAMMRLLTGWPLKDSQPGIFAVSKQYIDVFRLPGNYNYTQQVLLDAYHKGMRFDHVDVTFDERTKGHSFISLKYPFKVLPQLFWVLAGVAPMRIFVPLGLCFLIPAICVFVWQLTQFFMGLATSPVENVNFVMGTGLFGMQCIFFGVLAQLIIEKDPK